MSDKKAPKVPIFNSRQGGFTEDKELIEPLYTGTWKPTGIGWVLMRVKGGTMSVQDAYTHILLMVVTGDISLTPEIKPRPKPKWYIRLLRRLV